LFAYGSAAFDVLGLTLQAIPDDIPVILDAKRGDVPNTSAAYADALFDSFHADAVTVAPYVGMDSIEPFCREGRYALVLATGFWNPGVFAAAVRAVAPGGVLAWEAFTMAARQARPTLPAEWCLGPGEPATLLPDGMSVASQEDVPGAQRGIRRRLLARRTGLGLS